MSTKKKSMNTPEDTSRKYFHPDIKEPQVLVCEFSEELSPRSIKDFKIKLDYFDRLFDASEGVSKANIFTISGEMDKLAKILHDIDYARFRNSFE